MSSSAAGTDQGWEDLAAFANTRGGTLFVGVDDNGEIFDADDLVAEAQQEDDEPFGEKKGRVVAQVRKQQAQAAKRDAAMAAPLA